VLSPLFFWSKFSKRASSLPGRRPHKERDPFLASFLLAALQGSLVPAHGVVSYFRPEIPCRSGGPFVLVFNNTFPTSTQLASEYSSSPGNNFFSQRFNEIAVNPVSKIGAGLNPLSAHLWRQALQWISWPPRIMSLTDVNPLPSLLHVFFPGRSGVHPCCPSC